MARAKKTGRKRNKRKISLPIIPLGGDHGAATPAATAGTFIEPITNEAGHNPNNIGRRRREEVISTLSLTMRQLQAAQAIRDAFCRVQALSSGGPLKERVQASPKPDATVAVQVDAQSRWVHVTRAIPRADRHIVDHVCCANLPMRALVNTPRSRSRLAHALDLVADHLRF